VGTGENPPFGDLDAQLVGGDVDARAALTMSRSGRSSSSLPPAESKTRPPAGGWTMSRDARAQALEALIEAHATELKLPTGPSPLPSARR